MGLALDDAAGLDDPDLDHVRAARLADLAALRWAKSQTFTFNGTPGVACDDTAQGRLTAAVSGIKAAVDASAWTADQTVGWEVTPGAYVDMTLADLQGFGVAMLVHVQGCWKAQQTGAGQVAAAADIPALQALDFTELPWPA